MAYLGDYKEDSTKLGFEWTTRNTSSDPTDLLGGPVLTVVKISDGTSKTSAEAFITLSASGAKNRLKIDLSGHAFFSTGEDYSVFISTGTVDGGTVVKEVVALFSIENRFMRGTDSAALATDLSDIQGTTFDSATDSLEAIRDRGDSAWITGGGGGSDRLLMADTTIATLASQTSFTLSAGSADDNAYNNCTIVIEDAATSTQKAVGLVVDYVGSTKTITLKYDPSIFTMATTDKVYILAENSLKSVAANRQLNVTPGGVVDANLTKIKGLTASATNLQDFVDEGYDAATNKVQGVVLVDANTDMVGTNNAATAADLATVDTVVDGIQTDLSNETDGLSALKALLDAIPTTAMRGTDSALTDKAGFSLSTAGILAIWHQALTAIVTASTVGKLIKDNLNAAVGNIPTTPMRGTDNAATAGNLATVDTVVDGIQTDLSNGDDGLGALKTLLNAIPTTAMRGTNNAALAATAFNASTGSVKLSATGLDSILISQVTGPATKWSEMLVQLWRAEHKKRILNKVDSGSGTMSYRNDADDANLLQAAYTEDSTDQTMGNVS